MQFKIPFSARAHHYTDEEIATVVSAMKDAEPLTQGKYRDAFEKTFRRYLGVDYCYTVSNATCGLEMAAQLCQFKEDDEVIVPSHTFTSSVYPFIKNGAKIAWCDIDLRTRIATHQTISDRITPRTKAIIVPHLYGFMADMPSIMKLAEKYGLLVIEDAAQVLGTDIEGRKAGSFGHISVFSFQSHKNISTLGEGGMIVVKDERMAEIIPMLRHNGHCPFNFERDHYWIPAMGNVDFPHLHGDILWPNNYCLGEVECALGIKLLERIDTINDEKRKRALYFIDNLSEYTELEFHRVDSTRHNYHLLAARVTNGKRDQFIRTMAEEKRIQCVVQYYPLHRYDLYQKAGFGKADVPNTDLFFDNMISFPFHHWLNESDFLYMIDSTKKVLTSLK